ncbi:MAG: O-antigen ligase family protein [Bacteroidota bacterium]
MLFAAAWLVPAWLPVFPVVLVGLGGILWLIRHPLAHLAVVLFGFVLILDYTEGISILELAFTAYYLTFLAAWYALRFACRLPVVIDWVDRVVIFFLIFLTASLPLIFIFGADVTVAISQWRSVCILAFYFPIKWVIRENPNGLKVMVVVFSGVVAFVSLRNFIWYFQALGDAEALWQIATNRSTRQNERLLMLGMIGGLVFVLIYCTTWRQRILGFIFTSIPFAGIIVGQSRTIWLAVMLAMGVLFVLASWRERMRMVGFGVLSFVVLSVAAVFLLNDLATVVLSGLSSRLGSIGSAASSDISFINRLYEWRTALVASMDSPLIGRGFGVPYSFYNIIYSYTEVKHFSHSTYIGVFYRHGLVGLGCVLLLLGGSFTGGIRALRAKQAGFDRAVNLACVVALPAIALAATTEALLIPPDGNYAIMYVCALLAGVRYQQASHVG